MKTNNFIICSVSVNMCSLLCLMDNTDQELNALDNANKLGKLRLRLVRGMAIPLKNNNNFYWKWKRVE
jgi:hypothetical protein